MLSQYYVNTPSLASRVTEPLDRMEQVVPRRVIPMDYRTKIFVANLYAASGKTEKFHEICNEIVAELKPIIERGSAEPLTADNPYVVLLQTYETMHQYDDALKLVELIRVTYSHERDIDQILNQLRARLMAEKTAEGQKDSIASKAPVKGK
jgi:hypothetical protein